MLKDAIPLLRTNLKEYGCSKTFKHIRLVSTLRELVGMTDVEAFCLLFFLRQFKCPIKGDGKEVYIEIPPEAEKEFKTFSRLKGLKLMRYVLAFTDEKFKKAVIDVDKIHLKDIKLAWTPINLLFDYAYSARLDFYKSTDTELDYGVVNVRVTFVKDYK